MSSVAVKRPNVPGGGPVSSSSSSLSSCSMQQSAASHAVLLHHSAPSPSPSSKDETTPPDDFFPHTKDEQTSPGWGQSEESLQWRLQEALRERDAQWMKHEREQIAFIQQEGGTLLKGLHFEIQTLSNRLRECRRLLDVGPCSSERELAAALREREGQVEEMEEALREKEERLAEIECKVTATVERMTEQINLQADRIRQLNSELHDRTQTVAQLSSQLRSFRLKEAMSLAQQRRRVSNASNNTSPLVSPSSPHRTFPPFSPSFPTYPGGSQSARGMSSSASSALSPALFPMAESLSNNIDDKAKHSRSSLRLRARSNSAFSPSSSLPSPPLTK